jgi:hypothetical protein
LFVSLGCGLSLTWGDVRRPCYAAGAANIQQNKKDERPTQDKPASPAVKLIEGERVSAGDVVALVRSMLVEEGEAVKKLSEANLNNVRYNINSYPIGYAIATEKVNDQTVFSGPLKGWRAKAPGEVSTWPPLLYTVSRKETMRQAKLIEPIPVADAVDEMNNLRVYYRPLLAGHDGEKYQEQPTALAFFVHPKTGTRMTLLFRDGRSSGSVAGPLVANAKVFVKEVAPGRGKESTTLVPSIFYTKEVSFDVDAFPKREKLDRLMHALLAAYEKPPLATADFKLLFEEMSEQTGGKTVPVAKSADAQSTQRK